MLRNNRSSIAPSVTRTLKEIQCRAKLAKNGYMPDARKFKPFSGILNGRALSVYLRNQTRTIPVPHPINLPMFPTQTATLHAVKALSYTNNPNSESRLKVARDLISKGRPKDAQDLLLRAGDVSGYLELCKTVGHWEEALKMSEKLGHEVFLRVALEWGRCAGAEKTARILKRFGKLNECVEAALKDGEHHLALAWTKNGDIPNMEAIVDKVVESQILVGDLEKAAKLYCDYGRYRDAVNIFITGENWAEAEQVASNSGDPKIMKQVHEAELESVKKLNDFSRLEALALRLGRVQLAVDAYVEAGLHSDAERLRNEYSLGTAPLPVNPDPGFVSPFTRAQPFTLSSSPSTSSAVDRFVDSNDWTSALALAQSMHPEVLPDLVRKWLASMGDLKSLPLTELMPLLARYGDAASETTSVFLCAVGKYQCGQPWSLDYKVWAALRDCFWSVAETWELSDDMRPLIERYFWTTHLMAVKCACVNQSKMEPIVARALIGLLRYVDLLPANWLFLEAGKYAQGQDWITVAFILYNGGLDLYDIIEENGSSESVDPVEWEEWAELGLPIDQMRLEELSTEETKVAKARDWVLSISLDPRAAKDVNIGAYAALSPYLGGRTSARCVLTGCNLKPPVVRFENQLCVSKNEYKLIKESDSWKHLEVFLNRWVGQAVE